MTDRDPGTLRRPHRSPARPAPAGPALRLALGTVLALGAWGCQLGGPTVDPASENRKLKDELAACKVEAENLRQTVAEQRKQLDVARGFTDADRKKIFAPVQINILTISGGENYDDKPGDDGVTVHFQPLDEVGDALKVAGDVRIELYDLANPEGRKLIGEYYVPADKIGENWYGKLMTYHYTIRCPWQQGPPQHSEITIRLTFVDYLSQRVINAQKVVTVRQS